MTQGLRVSNTNGFVQIDDTYSNFALAASGSISVAAQNNNDFNTWTRVTFANYGVVPLVLVRTTVGQRVRVGPISSTGFNVRFVDVSGNAYAGTLEWRIYIPMNSLTGVPLASHGLLVNKPDGSVAFRSDLTLLKIATILNFTGAEFGNATPQYKASGLASPFASVNSIANSFFRIQQINSTASAFFGMGLIFSGGSISITAVQTSIVGGAINQGTACNQLSTIIDARQ